MAAKKAPRRREARQHPPAPRISGDDLLKRAMGIARMGYWQAATADSPNFWISPELAAMYEMKTDDGAVPILTVRGRYLAESRPIIAHAYEQCWRTGETYAVHGRFQRRCGEIIDYMVHGEAERDEDGGIRRVSGIVRDVSEEMRAMRRMAESEQRLADFVATASDWCWESDSEHRLLPHAIHDGSFSAIQMVAAGGKPRWELSFLPEDRDAMAAHRADMEAHRPFHDFTYSVTGADGSCVTIRSSGKPNFDASGVFLGYRGTASDISKLRRTEDMLDRRTSALREAHRLGKIGTWSYRLGDRQVAWAPEVFALLGLDPETFDTTHQNILACFLDDGAARVVEMQRSVIRTRRTETVDVQVGHADGSVSDLALTCKAELADGRVLGLIGTIQDVTERKHAQRQLEHLAYSDPLTGLANRALFKRELAALIDFCFRNGTNGSLLLIDLDRFKEVNDSLGHAAGDELLTRVALLLRQELGPRAFVARLGGDEFAILPERHASGENVIELADRIIARLSGPIDLSEGEAFIGATVGIANLPDNGGSVDIAMRNADLALYMAKEAGRGRAMVFEPAYAVAVEQRLDLGRHLRHAVEEGALNAHYQAQVDLSTRRVIGFEALLRWTHPERGPISPAEFIPIAESSGLIVDLGLWVLREACRQGRTWLDAGLPARTVSVNVSPAQFWNMDFETAVSAVLWETGLPPDLLCLELTESLFVDHSEQRISRTLTALSALGVRLALDDFGSGYSSIGYLTRLPFDRLKVDRSFVDGIATKPEKRKLLGGIIALSRGLGMTVVAEGAERAAEVDVLADLGCDIVQGFVFARPVTPDMAPVIAASIERERGMRTMTVAPGNDDEALIGAATIGV
ncbi:putative bifunctional diguanylate cyclase/phosphodiesterase [Phreatobacter sp.]|uniref:putative bifunctional diguanylate cyclase/phosphodiesterase n=1 Tax=Phreatobacter sp. TaxID=1966341 RepID=UPI0025DABB04|nr:EAL domain-containing protein [Phreatobacter sp.]